MLINETLRVSDVLLFEEGEEVNFVRENVTVVSGTVASPIGQVLGKITASGKYAQVTTGAVDGSQTAAAVLLTAIPANLGADTVVVALTTGPAILKSTGLSWTTGMTAPQIATAIGQLATQQIKVRTAYGV